VNTVTVCEVRAAVRKTQRTRYSAGERRRISDDELDEIGVPPGAGLFEQAADTRPDRRVRDAERRRDFRNAAQLDDGKQHAQLGRRQFERRFADRIGAGSIKLRCLFRPASARLWRN
jgi:hypothetical protein